MKIPAYYKGYTSNIENQNVLELWDKRFMQQVMFASELEEADGNYRYADGKWTIGELIGHLIDCERMFQHRMFLMANYDNPELVPFDQDVLVAKRRDAGDKLELLLDEWEAVMMSPYDLLIGLHPDQLLNTGTIEGNESDIEGIAYILVGHEWHHLEVLVERYGITLDYSEED
jgi:hypothetical protein